MVFTKIFPFRHGIYLLIIGIVYYSGTYLIGVSEDTQLEGWRIPDLSKYSGQITLLIQATMGAIIAISVFYIGKNHDLAKSFIDKLGELEKIKTNLETNKPSNSKALTDCDSAIKRHKEKLSYIRLTAGTIISFAIAILMIFGIEYFLIQDYSSIDTKKENFSFFLSLIISVVFFFYQWHFLDFMLSNREKWYEELVFDVAHL